MKIRGQNSNRNGQQTAEKGQKIPGDNDATDITSLVQGIENSRLRNGLELARRDRTYNRFAIWQVAYEFSLADHEHFKSFM